MRTAPAVRLVVRRQGVWRAAVCTCVVLAVAAGATWLVELGDAAPIRVRALLTVALVACAAVAASAARIAEMQLVWDGQVWQLARASAGDHAMRTGSLAPVIDLGPWMLLRVDVPAAAGARARRIWLPVQRRGLEPHWHALRCAVHAAVPSPSLSPSRSAR